MAKPRLLIAIAHVLLLSACTTGPVRTQATAAGDHVLAEVASPADATADATAVHDGHLHAAPPQAPALASPVVVPLDAASLAALPRDAVTAIAQGETLKCEGVALPALMQAAGAMPVEPLHGAQLGRYVLAGGRDGDRVLFSLSEFDPTLGNRSAFVVDRCNGQQLDDSTGPLQLIVPGDTRPTRWVRQLQTITVIVAP